MKEYESGELEPRTVKVTIAPHGEAIFCERATSIEIFDDAAGEYLIVSQCKSELKQIEIDPTEWPIIRKSIDEMINECRS